MSTETDIPPLDVRIVAGTENLTKEKRPKEYRTSHRTIVLTAANPAQNIVGYDPGRKEMYINSLDNPIVLSGDTSQANDANNISGTLATPNGRLLATGIDFCIPGPNETWISAAVFPSRVGVTIIREI